MTFNDPTKDLFHKYMAFHNLMLEDHSAVEIAGTIAVQALSFYKTILSEAEYEIMTKTIYESRHEAPKFKEE